MASFNNVTLLGNLTRDIELKYVGDNNTAVADMGLAVNNRVKRGGEWTDEPCFIDVTLWGRTAENCSEYLSKGSQCLVNGELRMDQWEDKETGAKRSKLYIDNANVTFTGSRGSSVEVGAATVPAGGDDVPF